MGVSSRVVGWGTRLRWCAASSPVACACSSRCICGRPGGQRWSLFRVPSLGAMCDFFFFLCVCAGGHARPCRTPTGAQSSPVVACNPWVAHGGVMWSRHCSFLWYFSCHPLPRHGRTARAEPRAPFAASPSYVRCRAALVAAAVRALCLLPCACHVPPHPAASVSRALAPRPACCQPPQHATPSPPSSSRDGRWGGRPLTPAAFEC